MEEKKHQQVQVKVIRPVKKSDKPEHMAREEGWNSSEWISQPVIMQGFRELVRESTILPQCIRSYRNNIAGFGLSVEYREDYDEETPEMKAEYDRMERIIRLLNFDTDVTEIFENLVESRETYGIGYLEVIRDMNGDVAQIEYIEDTVSITMTRPQAEYIEVPYFFKGELITRKKRFRKFRQQVGGKTVYFREFGDPRIMDKRSGEYVKEGETLELAYQANEILAVKNGAESYGGVRWEGQILTVDGCRSAEKLNNNYFRKGRHTPLAILINGGTLTEKSYEELQYYMNDIEGESGQHAFLLLETENIEVAPNLTEEQKPKIELKDLAGILQKDELFQNYLDNGRKKTQSAFLLPDLYTGYTTDFNRSTAQTAMEVTEKQVFQPERKRLAWIINNRLLNGYGFRYCQVKFNAPDITNPDDIAKVLGIAVDAGGLTTNDAHDLACRTLGKPSEDYPEEFGCLPLQLVGTNRQPVAAGPVNPDFSNEEIEKDSVVAVMKDIRKALGSYCGEDKG